MKTLKERVEDALNEVKHIERSMEQGTLNRAHILRWDAQIDYLVDFVHSEVGRAADPALDQSAPLVLYCASEADREEIIAACEASMPNATWRKMP